MYNMINDLKDKSVIIYGVGKFQRDFQYIFDTIDIKYYITDKNENNTRINNKPVYNFDTLRYENLKNVIIIICKKNKENAIKNLETLGLEYKANYIYGDDMFHTLDNGGPYIDQIIHRIGEKKIAVWGTGASWLRFKQQLAELRIKIDVDLFIDKDNQKSGHTFEDKIIQHPDQIKETADQYYVINANVYYSENKSTLESWGLREYYDYMQFSDFIMLAKRKKPSELLKETIYSEPIDAAVCNRPFTDLTINDENMFCCNCSGWVKLPIGNLKKDTLEDSWNSIEAKIFRLSVINKTFCFCYLNRCPLLGRDNVSYRKPLDQSSKFLPRTMKIEIDYTCNLYCSSCRNNIAVAKGSDLEDRFKWADKVIKSGWMTKVHQVILAGSGEVFFSSVYKKLLYYNNDKKRDSISIITNGNLMNQSNLNKLIENYDNIDISISIDAATSDTYHKLRRGGNWNILQNNLAVLSQLRKNKKVRYVTISMVVQYENYREMVDFIKMAQKFSFDTAYFSRIENWGTYTDQEFGKISMINQDDTIKPELEDILKDSIFESKVADIGQFKKYLK